MFQTLKTVAAALALVGVSAAQAATISVDPASQTAAPGPVSVDIVADFNEATLGGDFTVNFNPGLLNFLSSTTGPDFFVATTNVGSGTVDFSVIANDIAGFSGQGVIKTLNFQYSGTGSAAIDLAGQDWAGLDLGSSIATTYVGGEIKPAVVPIPAAAWLMLSGLGLVGGAIRKRR